MLFIILIALSFMLFGGFLLLTAFERSKELRVLGVWRNKLDRIVSRAMFIARHVDWAAFIKHVSGTVVERVLHDIAHGILRMVRFIERLLTKAVKKLREKGNHIPDTDDEVLPSNLFARIAAQARSVVQHARRIAPRKKKLPEA